MAVYDVVFLTMTPGREVEEQSDVADELKRVGLQVAFFCDTDFIASQVKSLGWRAVYSLDEYLGRPEGEAMARLSDAEVANLAISYAAQLGIPSLRYMYLPEAAYLR